MGAVSEQGAVDERSEECSSGYALVNNLNRLGHVPKGPWLSPQSVVHPEVSELRPPSVLEWAL